MPFICNKRTPTQYIWSSLVATVLVVCGVVVYISLLFGKDYQYREGRLNNFSNRPEKLEEKKCITVCDSAECVGHSKLLSDNVETATDPCDNFFEFACGKYVDRFRNESQLVIYDLAEKMKIMLRNVLENIDADPKSSSGKLKIVYDSCIKQDSSDFKAIPTLLQYLTKFGIPNWPNLDSEFKFVESKLTDVLGNFLTYKEYGFIDVDAKYVPRKLPYSEVNATIKISEGTYQKKDNRSKKYLLERTLLYFDLDFESINETWEESEAIYAAITHLKEESSRMVDENVDPHSKIPIDCSRENEPEWNPICEILRSFVDTADVSAGINKRFFEVYENSVHFMKNIIPVLSNFSDRSIANYLAINLLFNRLDDLNFYFRLTLQKDTSSSIVPKLYKKEIDNWQHCVGWLIGNMFMPLGQEYMKQVFTAPIRQEVQDLIEECIRETADSVYKQEWVSEPMRTQYGQETGNITYLLSKLHVLTNETFFNELYDQFHPTIDSFFKNVLEYQRYTKAEEMFGILRASGLLWITSELLMQGASGGGFDLNIYLGLYWPPFFRTGLQRLINLVTFAMTAEHEIGHSLHIHSYYIQEVDSTAKEYLNKTNLCLENQYSQFRFEHIGKNMDGRKYIFENTADVIAISIIDKLIEKYTSEDDVSLLPAFPYSAKQLLYISSVQMWCGSFTKKDEEFNYNFDAHTLGNFRVLGMMQNSKGFAEAFTCPEGSYMNPATKCSFLE